MYLCLPHTIVIVLKQKQSKKVEQQTSNRTKTIIMSRSNTTTTTRRVSRIHNESTPLSIDSDSEIPIVSFSDSQLLRDKLIEANSPNGIHQKILRNSRFCFKNEGITLWECVNTIVKSYFPILVWIWDLTRGKIFGDIMAGITVGIMLIPQAMS